MATINYLFILVSIYSIKLSCLKTSKNDMFFNTTKKPQFYFVVSEI